MANQSARSRQTRADPPSRMRADTRSTGRRHRFRCRYRCHAPDMTRLPSTHTYGVCFQITQKHFSSGQPPQILEQMRTTRPRYSFTTGPICAGAVQFFDAEIDRPPARISGLIPVDDAKIGEQLRAIKRSPGAWVLDDTTGRFSLGGAQAKFTLSLSDQGWAQPTGDLPSTHIFKPGIPEYHDQAMNEHLTLSIARELGLNAADTEILNFDGEQAIVVTRYDRETRPDGEVARIHQEDFAQALSVSPSQKHEDQGGPTISQMSALLRRHQSSTRAKKSMEQFLTSVFFNWLVLAPDAHAKNYSVLLRRGDVDLAPLYDVASIAPYPERYRSNTVKLAQSVGGNMQVDRVGRTEWMTEASSSLGLDAEMFLDHCARLALRASSAVKAVCGRQRMRGVDPAFVTAYEEAVLERIEFAASVIMADD